MRRLLVLVTTIAALGALSPAIAAADDDGPLVIGHRGAGGYLPEHTLAGYALAVKLGADYIEPDLVATKDGRLVARHEPNITNTTDVASRPEFADRKRTAIVDGATEEGWFASDFTLAEIRTLRAVQPFAERPQQFNGRFRIPTFDEVIDLAKRLGEKYDRAVGIYPETKHPTYHRELGLPLERRLLSALRRAGWDRRGAPVFIQSFEQSNLVQLSERTRVRLVQLVDANDVNADGTLDYTAPHNSCHRELSEPEQAAHDELVAEPGDYDAFLEYSHASLPSQLALQGMRGLELDLFGDAAGGRYGTPLVRSRLGLPALADPSWQQPAVKVLHTADLDHKTTCIRFVACLTQVRGWSRANPGHVPLLIMLELKSADPLAVAAGGVPAPPWDGDALDGVDAEVRSVFDEDEIITPDDVRRGSRTLEESVLERGWPSLARSGAQLISTDLPEVGMSARYDSDFVARLPDGGPARCNPVNAPEGCRDDRLER